MKSLMNSANAQAAITLTTIGDSIMSDYDENTTDKRSRGRMFQHFFTSDLLENNN